MLNVNQRLLVDVDTSEKLFDISGKVLFGISEKVLFGLSRSAVSKNKYKNNPSLELNKNRLKFFANLQDGMREPAQRDER